MGEEEGSAWGFIGHVLGFQGAGEVLPRPLPLDGMAGVRGSHPGKCPTVCLASSGLTSCGQRAIGAAPLIGQRAKWTWMGKKEGAVLVTSVQVRSR
jgi:hypothetical protein